MLESIFALLTLLLSAFFSGSETAFVSADRIQLEVLQKRKVRGSSRALYFLKKPERFLTITLVGNNIANVACTSFAAIVLINYFNELTVLIITSATILIFGEIVPKSIFRDLSNVIVPRISRVITLFYYLFYPFIYLCRFYSSILLKLFKVSAGTIENALSKDDLKYLFEEVGKDGLIDTHEREIIDRLFSFGKQTVGQAMTPRTEIFAVKEGITLEELERAFIESGHSKLPVYGETIDNIKGVIFIHDLFKNPGSVEELIKGVTFIPESKMAEELLKEFQEKKQSIGIVIDEYGGTAGLVTVEDLVEELFGEFEDEFDYYREPFLHMEDGSIIVDARAEVDYLNEKLKLEIPVGDYETIGGFVLSRLGHIPSTGENLIENDRRITVLRASRKKIEKIKIEPI
ncbi:MAG: hemolysin family protein [Fidelibacterota bacterium]